MQVLRNVLSYGLISKLQGYRAPKHGISVPLGMSSFGYYYIASGIVPYISKETGETITYISDLILSFTEFLASLPDFRERKG